MDSNELKKCADCGEQKILSEFSLVSGRSEAVQRWAAKCKSCKRKLRNANLPLATSNRTIELKKTAVKTVKHSTERKVELSSNLDFQDMETLYGKTLSRSERHEAVLTLNDFVSILKEGFEALKGNRIYVKKV